MCGNIFPAFSQIFKSEEILNTHFHGLNFDFGLKLFADS